MALKDLGKTEKEFYDGPEITKAEPRITYRDIQLPLELVKDMGLEVKDEVTLTLKGNITGLHADEYSETVTIEVHKGEAKKG